jgi:hypothetical protein
MVERKIYPQFSIGAFSPDAPDTGRSIAARENYKQSVKQAHGSDDPQAALSAGLDFSSYYRKAMKRLADS